MSNYPAMVLEDEGPIALYFAGAVAATDLFRRLASSPKVRPALAAAELSSFSAAVVDLGLPGISGEEVVKAFASMYPWLPILVSTGHDVRALQQWLPSATNIRVISKPFDSEDFLENIRQLRLVA